LELIDEGFQYRVYDTGHEVRKVPKSREQMIEYSMSWGTSRQEARKGTEKGIARRKMIEEKMKGRSLDVIADFRFEGSEIVQEKVRVTGEALQRAESMDEKKDIIDDQEEVLQHRLREEFDSNEMADEIKDIRNDLTHLSDEDVSEFDVEGTILHKLRILIEIIIADEVGFDPEIFPFYNQRS